MVLHYVHLWSDHLKAAAERVGDTVLAHPNLSARKAIG
jgi:hypothetical protein